MGKGRARRAGGHPQGQKVNRKPAPKPGASCLLLPEMPQPGVLRPATALNLALQEPPLETASVSPRRKPEITHSLPHVVCQPKWIKPV